MPFAVAVLLPVPEVDLEAVLEVDPGTGAVLEVGLGTEAVLVAGPGIEVDLEVDPGTVAVLEAVHEVGPGTVAVLEVVPGTEAELVAGLGTEVDLGVVPGIEAGPALAEGGQSLVVAEEELRAQIEGELVDLALSHAWALHSCPCPA